MVGLHMLHHQVVGLAAAQGVFNVLEPFAGLLLVDGVHDGDLVVENHIGIVAHAVGHHILTLEEIHLVVVGADINNGIGDFFQHLHCSFTAFVQDWT